MYSRVIQTMKSNSSETIDEMDGYYLDVIIPERVRIILLLGFDIPSIICYLLVLSCILMKRSLRSASNNYAILFMLFNSFLIVCTDIPWLIYYYQQHMIAIQSPIFCLIWWFVDVCCLYTSQILAAWISFERHILIFHSWILNKKWRKICFHYLTPILLLIYSYGFYIYVIFLMPCEDRFNLSGNSCSIPCYFTNISLGLYETVVHGIFTTICIVVFSGGLVFRIYRSKMRLQQSINWRKYHKMFCQLVSISLLYLSTNFPLCITYIFYYASYSNWTEVLFKCLGFLNYFIPLLLPFVCLASLPEIWNDLKRLIHRRRNRQIQSII